MSYFCPQRHFLSILPVIFAVLLISTASQALTVEGFLEPNKQVDLVPAIRDTIKEIHVDEGDFVKQGQTLVTLNDDVLQARLKSAEIQAKSQGRINSTSAIVDLREKQLENLEKLSVKGHVRKKELERARTDLAIGQADLLTAKEEQASRKANVKLIKTQIDEKVIKAPFDGIVISLNKGVGELVGNSDKDVVLTLVQPNPPKAVFHLPYDTANKLKNHDQVRVTVIGVEQKVIGEIAFISPVINPESGTVRVKVKINDTLELKSGLRCQLTLE